MSTALFRIVRVGLGRWAVAAFFILSTSVVPAAEERWTKVTAPEFTVVSALKEKETVAWAGEFAQFIHALKHVVVVDTARLTPLTIVLFKRGAEFKEYLPLDPKGKPINAAGLFSQHETWSVASVSGSSLARDTRRIIFHEGVHWLMQSDQQWPVWLEEGMAEVFSTFTVVGDRAVWGRTSDDRLALLRDHFKPFPMEAFLYFPRGQLFHNGDLVTGVAYAQCWAFMHYLLFGQNDLPANALERYRELYSSGMLSEELVKETLGGDYKQLDARLERHLQTVTKTALKDSRTPLVEVPPMAVSPATAGEVELALGRLAWSARRTEQARAHAVKAAQGDDPEPYEFLAEVLMGLKDETAALEAYRQAYLRKSRDYRVHYRLGIMGHRTISTANGLSKSVVAQLYRQAIELNPRHLSSYQNLAAVVEGAPDTLELDTRIFTQGRSFFPDDGSIAYGLAVLKRQMGDRAAADALLDDILTSPESKYDRRAREMAEGLRIRDLQAEVTALRKEQKFREALALVEAQLEKPNSQQNDTQLRRDRRALRTSFKMAEAQAALKDRRWTEGRALLEELIEGDYDPYAKTSARQWMEKIPKATVGSGATPAVDVAVDSRASELAVQNFKAKLEDLIANGKPVEVLGFIQVQRDSLLKDVAAADREETVRFLDATEKFIRARLAFSEQGRRGEAQAMLQELVDSEQTPKGIRTAAREALEQITRAANRP